MMVAMATDVRVILIKLADRLHNMRTLSALPKQKQIEKARETLEIYAPLAHRLGIHAIKWELEDLAFQRLHPRKYDEIKKLVAQQRAERERYVEDAGSFLAHGAEEGRDRGRDLGPRQALLLDLLEDDEEGPRVQRDLRPHRDAGDRRLGQGLLRRDRDHPLALEAAAGRASRTSIATPKLNLYQALHTTVIGPEGRPLEIQIRTPDMHELAEYGIAAHVIYKEGGAAAQGPRAARR